MDRFEEMQTFVRVAESGSLSAAAERMNIARSAVSRWLADLVSPDFICEVAIASGLLRPILAAYPQMEMPVYVIYPSQRHLPNRVRSVIDFLVQRFTAAKKTDQTL